MSKNRNRAKFNQAHNGREYLSKMRNELYPPYWDEGILFYPRYRKGFKNSHKCIFNYQVRRYRTWKHNRKTQWKQIK